MNQSDQNICERVLSPGRSMGQLKLIGIQRAGTLMLALPMNTSLALATLGLYQPQKLKGRLFRFFLSVVVKCGLHRRASKISFEIGDRGLFSGLKEVTDCQKFGFLLSGADSKHRKLIGLCEIGGQRMVVKAGCDEAIKVVTQEYEIQCNLIDQIPGVPSCQLFFKIDRGVAYVSELVYGRSPKGSNDDAVVFSLIRQWLGVGKRGRVSELLDWDGLQNCLNEKEKEYFELLQNLEVINPTVHGDFTPWNIKIDKEGGIKVLDWEHATLAGMPGWDWLHYHVQRLKLVEGARGQVIIDHCRNLMVAPPFAEYLKEAGLEGHEDALLGSYLFFTAKVHNYPREEEIQFWLSTRQK